MGYFSLPMKGLTKLELMQVIKTNAELYIRDPDCDYLIDFIAHAVDLFKEHESE